ncbi:hypothetical protein HU200_011349 [Digitaria exilis]|uniref:Cytokinin dehydrogenase 1 FAD/cytokinin binding domain-containing protein n=1 Tax=Digitaria exilis TaxID=1010633 RepID=A0A835KMR5_9POAL|nr:hypothetical protein HU200_011349 [Digitaria exilis]
MARDFGNRCSLLPAAVLHPGSVSDIAAAVGHVFSLGERSPLTVAARGHGHSLMCQSQAAGGIVVRMESLRGDRLQVVHGAACHRSSTHREESSGSTCSTRPSGRGDVVTCSPEENADLFYAALGGLGQFGIITRARIALEPAPKMVRWIRVLYSDFASFTEDQEMLIMAEKTFDYIEGFVIINRTGILNNWRTSFKASGPSPSKPFSVGWKGFILPRAN